MAPKKLTKKEKALALKAKKPDADEIARRRAADLEIYKSNEMVLEKDMELEEHAADQAGDEAADKAAADRVKSPSSTGSRSRSATPAPTAVIIGVITVVRGNTPKPTQSVHDDETSGSEDGKKALPLDLTPEQEDELIEWVKDNPILYHRKMNVYKRTDKKTALWDAKGLEMKISG